MKYLHSLILILSLWNGVSNAQPYILSSRNDKQDDRGIAYYVVRINVRNGFVDTLDHLGRGGEVEDNTQTWLIFSGNGSSIQNINNKKIFYLNYEPGLVLTVKAKDKMYIVTDTATMVVLNTRTGKEKTLMKVNMEIDKKYTSFPGNRVFLSADENKFYLPFYDAENNPINMVELSTSTNKIMKRWRFKNIGYPGAYLYDIVSGNRGKAIIISDNYYSIYDFEHDSSSPFIYYQNNVDPYFTNDGKYLILNEIRNSFSKDSTWTDHNTGKFLVYNVSKKKLVKTLNFPHDRYVFTFDYYPDNIYYFDYKTEKIITLNIDSLVNTSSGKTDTPKVIMYNLGNTVFTADFINSKINYELGNGFTVIKPETAAGDNLVYNEFDEKNNLLGVFSFDKGYIKGTYSRGKDKKVFSFIRIDTEP